MSILLETPRLYLREFIIGDTLDLFQLNANSEVLKFTSDQPFTSKEEAESFITTYIENVYKNPKTQKRTGLGRFAVLKKNSHEFIGWCGLKYNPDRGVVDLGFRLHQCYWNKGYATETALATIKHGFDTLKLPSLVGHSHVENIGSQKVLEHCGFTKNREIAYDGQPTYLYTLSNNNYNLKEIVAKETWPVRHPVLRKGRPLEEVYMEADEKETTFHLGMFYKDEIVGVASFMEDNDPLFKGIQSRLRGMAVLPNYRKKGLAALLLKRGEHLLKERGRTILWFNARSIAVDFYKNQGYKTVGEQFDIPKIGAHYKMKKEL